jgi:uncharacterized protein YbjT (DUF2867 family)
MKAIIFGATGMVGSEVLHYCLNNDEIESVISIGRRSTGVTHAKLQEIEQRNFLNFSNLEDVLKDVDVCYYCLGVYQTQVDKQTFWEITVGYVSSLIGILERANPEIRFCLFSAQGADQTERTPFLFGKAKGRAEKYLLNSKIRDKYIFRPGFINPSRTSSGFKWYSAIFKPFYKLMPFIGIDAEDLGKAIASVGIKGYNISLLDNSAMRDWK